MTAVVVLCGTVVAAIAIAIASAVAVLAAEMRREGALVATIADLRDASRAAAAQALHERAEALAGQDEAFRGARPVDGLRTTTPQARPPRQPAIRHHRRWKP